MLQVLQVINAAFCEYCHIRIYMYRQVNWSTFRVQCLLRDSWVLKLNDNDLLGLNLEFQGWELNALLTQSAV